MATPLLKLKYTGAFDRRKIVRRTNSKTNRVLFATAGYMRKGLEIKLSKKQPTETVVLKESYRGEGGRFVAAEKTEVAVASAPGDYPYKRTEGKGAGSLARLVRFAVDTNRQVAVVGPLIFKSTGNPKKYAGGAKTGAEALAKGGTVTSSRKSRNGRTVFRSRIEPRPFISLIRPKAADVLLDNMRRIGL